MFQIRSYFNYRNLSKEAKDALALMIIQGMNYIIPLITVPYLIATLGATGYGYIGFSLAYVGYFGLIVKFGFGLSATKRMVYGQSIGPATAARIFTATVYAKFLLFAIAVIPYFLLPVFIPTIRQYATAIYCMFPLLVGQTITMGWFFQSIGKIRVIAFLTGLTRILILPLIFIFVKSPTDYPAAALIQSGVVFAAGIISIGYLIFKHQLVLRYVTLKHVKIELSESFPLFLSGVATSIYTQLFTIMLGFLSSPAVVGVYSASERIIRVLCFSIYTPINQAFFPKLARLAVKSRIEAKRLAHKILTFLCIVMGFVGIFILFFAPEISIIIGKGKYDGMTTLLRIMSLAPLIISIGGVFGQSGLVAMGDSRSKKDFRNTYFIAGLVALILITILAPLFEDVGAAIAMTATEGVVTAMMIYYVKKRDKQRLSYCKLK